MPYFMVGGLRDGSRDPLYVEAMNADEALSKASKRGMHTTGVRPAKSFKLRRDLGVFGMCVTGMISLHIDKMSQSDYFVPVLLAYLSILLLARLADDTQASIKKLEDEVAALREIVTERKPIEAEQPSSVG